jgi:carbonic anhydrase/acetyltransferase-like protein (isoleucine patch superfamily)
VSIYEFSGRVPSVSEDAYVSAEATVLGDVTIGPGCFIGPGARIKGDYGSIAIGAETSIQENVVIHARPGERCEIGSRVNVGHGAIIHGGMIADNAVIGMGAVISDFAEVGDWAIVAEGCVVPAKFIIPDEKIAVGVPAKIVGAVNEEMKKTYERFKDIYVELSKQYKTDLKKMG